MTGEHHRQESIHEPGRLQEHLGRSTQRMSAFLAMSPSVYAERLLTSQWLPIEAERLQLLERAFNEAKRIFQDDANAGRWLDSPIISMCNRRPAEQLKAAGGLELVLATLAHLERGAY
jgi:putative toxin-antitoxin system antitoxin component (TIGR02293 family)